MSDQVIRCQLCGSKHSKDAKCVVNSKPVYVNVAAKAKEVLGRIRALEVRAQSFEARIANQEVNS